ncbi:MAG: GNAT family N-acetyltransferase [Rhizobiales bacterium]|nr:GNAT family N-acetyltransferase [Hyphomicrobiales bacterium]
MVETAPPIDVLLREMTPDDLVAAHGLSREVSWPHRLEDWQFVHRLGHGMVAEIGGTVAGTAMWWPFGERAATLGMVVVAAERQGLGIGRKLMEAVLGATGDRAVTLNATEAGRPLYERLGFREIGTVRQHQGTAFSVPLAPLESGERIRPIGRADETALAALDLEATGRPRTALLSALLGVADGIALDRNGETVGFALFRRFGRGYVIGPVVAENAEGAKALISHWVGAHAGMFLRIDVPGDSGLSGWLNDLGLTGVDPVATMARGTPPLRGTTVGTFAAVNQALG